ncbi:MAG: type II secretion system F family protein [bacterium]
MSKEYDFFIENLSMLMRSALPVREAVSTLKEEIKSKKLRKAITVIENEIDAGSKMSTALEKSGLLSARFISLLRLGEETGELQKQLAMVVQEQKKEKALESKIKGALIYPAIVLFITVVIGIFAMWYIFPKLTAVFTSAGGTLPLSTRVIMGIGNFLVSYGVIAVPLGFAAFGAFIYILFVYKNTRFIGETLLLRLSISHAIVEDIELSRFGYVMGSLLKSGITLPQALVSMRDSTTFTLYKKFYDDLLRDVTEGNSLYKSISNHKNSQLFVPSYLARLISAGEKSGSLSETLIDIGAMYETKTDSMAQNLSVMLEPIIIVVVGLMVAFLAVAIIGPVYGLSSQIH